MKDLLDHDLLDNNWFVFGFGLIILVPILLVIFNEAIYKFGKRDQRLKPPINLLRNIILPLIAMIIVFTQVIGFDRGNTIVKITETIIYILVINALLAIINVLFFSGGERSLIKTKIPQLFLDIFRVMMVLFGIAIVLSVVWNADLGGMVTALGLGSFVLGLALQDTLGNLFSGIALVYEKPFSEGDIIKVGDRIGEVVEMNWRAIRIRTREDVLIVIPHLVIGQETIENLSHNEEIVILKQIVGFAYSIPPNEVKEAIMKTCLSTPGILHDPPPEVKTIDFGDSKIDYEIEFGIIGWMNNEEILDDLMSRIWYTAKRKNLNIPFPQLNIVQSESHTTESLLDVKYHSFLEQLPKVMPVSKSGLDKIKDGMMIQYYGKGEYILKTGDKTGTLYIIINGDVALYTETNSEKYVSILELHKGDFFGEITMFTDKTSSFSVKAIKDIELLVIPSREVMELVQENPKFARYLDSMMDLRRDKALKAQLED